MGRPRTEMIGRVYDKLTVIGEAGVEKGHRYLFAQCSCEEKNIIRVAYTNLASGAVHSCGCDRARKPKGNKYWFTEYDIYVFNSELSDKDIANAFSGDGGFNNSIPYIAIVSKSQFDLIKDYTIGYDKGYDCCWIYLEGGRQVKLHRYLTDCPSELTVDHIHHNRKDNREHELRVCTLAENTANSYRFINSTAGERWHYDFLLRRAGIDKEGMMPENVSDIDKDTIDYNERSICTVEEDLEKWVGDIRTFDKDYLLWNTSREDFIEAHKDMLTEEQYELWLRKRKTVSRDSYTEQFYKLINAMLNLSEEDELEAIS